MPKLGGAKYRPDIDGLRAIAVMAVLLYHAGIPGFTGGFVGVDIFFVISGYLITRILVEEVAETGRLSITNFYVRRIRRIMPGLLVVIATTTAAAYILLFPSQLVDYGKSLLSTQLFASNIWFWSQAGYFRAQDDIIPLLHTWSLAVEEQFYIFMPLFIWWFRKHLKILIVFGLLSSLALSIVGMFYSPGATFYLLPTRAWELLIGSALAIGLISAPRVQASANIQSVLGLSCVLLSIFLIDSSMPFPGATALLPCVGTALLLNAHQNHSTAIGRILATKGFVGIGLISYSLYLWHWPILTFIRQYFGRIELSAGILAIAVSILLSWLSYYFIEQPARRASSFGPVIKTVVLSSATLCVVALLALGGLPSRFSSEVNRMANGADDRSIIAANCGRDCQIGTGPVTFALIGDSHAGAASDALDVMGKRLKMSGRLLQMNSCPPVLDYISDMRAVRDKEACRVRNTDTFRAVLADPDIQTVFLSGYWSNLQPDLRATLSEIADSGKFPVVLYDGPESSETLPLALARSKAFGQRIPALAVPDGISEIPGENWQYVKIADAFCTPDCAATFNGYPILSDTHHLSRTASAEVLGPFLAAQSARWFSQSTRATSVPE